MDTKSLFYRDKPIFGFDIGRSSIKVMQILTDQRSPVVTGYGNAPFDPKAIDKGVIVDPEAIVKVAY